MISTHRLLLCALVLLSQSVASHAQDRLFFAGLELGTDGRFGERLSEDPDVMGQAIAGGRYRLMSSLTAVDVVDMRTGQRYRLPVANPWTTTLTADPVRARMFLRSPGGPVVAMDLTTGAERPLYLPAPSTFVSMQYAYAADQLFINVNRGSPMSPDAALVVVDARSGSVIRTFDPWPATSVWMVRPDGRRVYYGTAGGQTMAALDVVNGSTVRHAGVEPLGMVLDEAGSRLLVHHLNIVPTTAVTVFDLDLNPIASTTLGGCARINVSVHTGRIYVVDEIPDGFGVAERLTALEADGSLRNRRVVGRYSRPVCYPVTLVTAPGQPRDVRATVTTPDVTLTWTNVGAASGFVLDIGLAPGRTDASVFLGPDPRAEFTGVPSGTYYLRVRGGNEFGGGRPSEELRVEVP